MLKVKFWRIENVVVMKILEQGDEIKRGAELSLNLKDLNYAAFIRLI